MENRINQDKTKLNIFGSVYEINDIELFYVEGNKLIFFIKDKVKSYASIDAPKCFREFASEFIITGLDNFALLITTNCMVNLNKIKNISKDNQDLNIETINHKYSLQNAHFAEYMCLKDKINKTDDKNLSK